MNCKRIGKGLGLILLALMLMGCRMQTAMKPDVIVDIPLNPTKPPAQTIAVSEPPETTSPVTEPVTETPTRPVPPPSGPVEPKPTVPQHTEPRMIKDTALAQHVAGAVNAQRQSAGLEPLRLESGLCGMADVRVREQQTVMGYVRPDGSGWETVLGGHSYGFTAELIHYGEGAGIVDRWMQARLHRAKLMSESAVSMGVAAYTAGEMTYVIVILVG